MKFEHKVRFSEILIWALFRYRHSTFLKLNKHYVMQLRRRKEPDKSTRGAFRWWKMGKYRPGQWNPRRMRAGTMVEPVQKK